MVESDADQVNRILPPTLPSLAFLAHLLLSSTLILSSQSLLLLHYTTAPLALKKSHTLLKLQVDFG